jgi:hypothetical protein
MNSNEVARLLSELYSEGLFNGNRITLTESGQIVISNKLRLCLARLNGFPTQDRVEMYRLLRALGDNFISKNEANLETEIKNLLSKFKKQKLRFQYQRNEALEWFNNLGAGVQATQIHEFDRIITVKAEIESYSLKCPSFLEKGKAFALEMRPKSVGEFFSYIKFVEGMINSTAEEIRKTELADYNKLKSKPKLSEWAGNYEFFVFFF